MLFVHAKKQTERDAVLMRSKIGPEKKRSAARHSNEQKWLITGIGAKVTNDFPLEAQS